MSYSLCSIHYMYTCDDTRKLWLLTHCLQVCSIFLSCMYGFLRIARSDASGLDRREFIRPPSSLTHFFSFFFSTMYSSYTPVHRSRLEYGPGSGFPTPPDVRTESSGPRPHVAAQPNATFYSRHFARPSLFPFPLSLNASH